MLQNSVALEYPEALRRLPEPPEGQVVVKFVVGVDGVPKELEIVQSVHPELDALARTAVEQLRYSPGLYKGRPIEVVLKLGIDIAGRAPRLLTEHPQMGLTDVYAAVLPKLKFNPGLHVFYEETVLRIPDGKPKQKDVPAELGGSGALLAD